MTASDMQAPPPQSMKRDLDHDCANCNPCDATISYAERGTRCCACAMIPCCFIPCIPCQLVGFAFNCASKMFFMDDCPTAWLFSGGICHHGCVAYYNRCCWQNSREEDNTYTVTQCWDLPRRMLGLPKGCCASSQEKCGNSCLAVRACCCPCCYRQ